MSAFGSATLSCIAVGRKVSKSITRGPRKNRARCGSTRGTATAAMLPVSRAEAGKVSKTIFSAIRYSFRMAGENIARRLVILGAFLPCGAASSGDAQKAADHTVFTR
jgi:hypothetical protein